MKRLLSFLIVLVLAGSFVLAQGNNETGEPEPVLISAKPVTAPMNNFTVGLNQALANVENENARAMLQRNLERFMEKYQARLEKKMQNVTIENVDEETGEATIKAREPVKYFGFIKGMATKRFDMDRNGNINERAPWYKLFYTEEE